MGGQEVDCGPPRESVEPWLRWCRDNEGRRIQVPLAPEQGSPVPHPQMGTGAGAG